MYSDCSCFWEYKGLSALHTKCAFNPHSTHFDHVCTGNVKKPNQIKCVLSQSSFWVGLAVGWDNAETKALLGIWDDAKDLCAKAARTVATKALSLKQDPYFAQIIVVTWSGPARTLTFALPGFILWKRSADETELGCNHFQSLRI